MRILVACEESQRVTIAFRKRGYEAFSCDIQEQSGGYPDWHIKGDALQEAYSGKYDMIISFPPCTYLSNAGAVHLYPKGKLNQERYQKGLEAKKFFLALLNAPADHIAVENPLPSRIYNLPPHTQVIQPYHFGHPFSKRTQLWLRNLPALEPTKIVQNHTPFVFTKSRMKHRDFVHKSKKERSKTFQGIAEAMADQWSNPVYMEQLKLF